MTDEDMILISIHALLAESDNQHISSDFWGRYFYPRSPCGERPDSLPALKLIACLFLSTLSLRRATSNADTKTPHFTSYFYPRSPCGERPIMQNVIFMPRKFLSTLSLRRATGAIGQLQCILGISIHALLAESDFFNAMQIKIVKIFLSTLSLRRATLCRMLYSCPGNFYPRSPCGERPPLASRTKTISTISIHALLAESDLVKLVSNSNITTFLSTLSLRRATQRYCKYAR